VEGRGSKKNFQRTVNEVFGIGHREEVNFKGKGGKGENVGGGLVLNNDFREKEGKKCSSITTQD